jgi:hypothetical protein
VACGVREGKEGRCYLFIELDKIDNSVLLSLPAGTLLLDESNGTVVQHSSAQAFQDSGLFIKIGFGGKDYPIHRGMESALTSIQLDNKIRGKGYGECAARTPGRSLILCPHFWGTVFRKIKLSWKRQIMKVLASDIVKDEYVKS